MNVLETYMAQSKRTPTSGAGNNNGLQFSPEADCDFDVVPTEEITAWRERLNAEYGIGTGKLTAIEEPAAG